MYFFQHFLTFGNLFLGSYSYFLKRDAYLIYFLLKYTHIQCKLLTKMKYIQTVLYVLQYKSLPSCGIQGGQIRNTWEEELNEITITSENK